MIATISALALAATLNTNVNLYAQELVITNTDNNVITGFDFNGNEWQFEDDVEDWIVGDLAACIMSDNGTKIIYYDSIVSCKYDGWLDGNWGFDGQEIVLNNLH